MKLVHFARNVRTIGVPGKIERPAESISDVLPKVLSQAFGTRTPEMIVNEYGMNGREFVILAGDLANLKEPKQLDLLTDGSGRYVAGSASALLEEGTGKIMGYRVYARGRK